MTLSYLVDFIFLTLVIIDYDCNVSMFTKITI